MQIQMTIDARHFVLCKVEAMLQLLRAMKSIKHYSTYTMIACKVRSHWVIPT